MLGSTELIIGLLVAGSQVAAAVAASKKKKAAAAAAEAALRGSPPAPSTLSSGAAAKPEAGSLRAILEAVQQSKSIPKQTRSLQPPKQPATVAAPRAPEPAARIHIKAVVPAAAPSVGAAKAAIRLPRDTRSWVIATEVLGRPRCESF